MIVLDAKTDYSFMRGFGTPEQWLARCKEIGVTVLGVTDYCSTWGHLPFRNAFKGSGVKLLYGVQVPVVSFLDKDPRHSLVTLLAKESTDELYAAMTEAAAQTYYRPRLTWKQIGELDDCAVVVNDLLRGHVNAVPATAYAGHRLMLPDHFPTLLPSVLAYAPRYPAPGDHVAFELFEAISQNHRFGEIESDAFHLLREREVSAIFTGYTPEMCANGKTIADACSAEPPNGKLLDMGVQGDKTSMLRGMAMEGAVNLGLAITPEYADRLELELSVIKDKQFEDYFFFVTDVISWAKERMFVGPGRGSAGGSLLCYLLGITTVDPIRFGTLFERFIDVTRSDLPDIDIDFPDTRREEVFTYLRRKYGTERFARLGTLTTLGGKSAINSVARATDVPFDVSREVGKFTEGVGQGHTISPEWIFENVQEVQPILQRWPSLRLATVIDGHVSHHGVHASGVVVTDGPTCRFGVVDKEGVLSMDMRDAEKIGLVKLDVLGLRTLSVIQQTCDLIGIEAETLYDLDWEDKTVFDAVFNADRVTGVFQFEGHAVRGLMKQVTVDRFEDVCALASLARPGPLVGGAAAGWVKARNGEAVGELLHPALEETFGVICYQEQLMFVARDIAGFDIPQVNGMRRAVAKKDPEKLRSFREAFINGCKRAASYCRASEKPKRSQEGEVGVGSEQWEGRSQSSGSERPLSDAAVPIIGTGSGERLPYDVAWRDEISDWIRSGKLATGTLNAIRELGDTDRAAALWEELNEFGSYSFNKAHAVAYGMISFMTAYLKTKHPLEFAVAQLRNAADDEQIKNLLRELVEEDYRYVPFDATRSASSWSIVDGVLYGGFDSIRGIGTKTAERLVAVRSDKGDRFLEALTDAQRQRIERGETRWVSLSYFSDRFAALYKNPDAWRTPDTPKGIKPPVYRVKDIPDVKGNYAFLGRVTKKNVVDDDAPERVAKRDGKKRGKDHLFINVTVEDDTGEISGTINRFKFDQFKWLAEGDVTGKDFLFRGNVIEAGRRWLFFDNILELKDVIAS